MNTPFVIVCGQMRSGTSLVAQMLHLMGCPMAVNLLAPMPPTYRMDWEDTDATLELFSAVPLGTAPTDAVRARFKVWIRRYRYARLTLARGQHLNALRHPPGAIGVKHPLFLHFRRELAEMDDVRIVTTRREQAAIDESVAHAFPPWRNMTGAMRTNELLAAEQALVTPDLEVSYERTIENPRGTAEALAGLIGKTGNMAAIERAAEAVKEPTSWAR